MASRKVTIDDGFNPELVEGAVRDGILGVPLIEPPRDTALPQGFTIFSQRHRAPSNNEALCFFEHDVAFADVLIRPDDYVGEFAGFQILVPPDCRYTATRHSWLSWRTSIEAGQWAGTTSRAA